jgi:hypothetical protein
MHVQSIGLSIQSDTTVEPAAHSIDEPLLFGTHCSIVVGTGDGGVVQMMASSPAELLRFAEAIRDAAHLIEMRQGIAKTNAGDTAAAHELGKAIAR